MPTPIQSGESPVRQLAEDLNAEQVADFNQNLRDAAILFATAILAHKHGLTTGELLLRWSPYR
jgi:hypothetical protein